MPQIMILNGPNLNLLGKRQPEIYGKDTLKDVEERCADLADQLGMRLECHQSNWEGQLVDWIHEARERCDGIVINAGALTHYSYAIFDALNSYDGYVFEIHISNVYQRETFRHHSVISPRADGVIAGFGVQGYEMALRRISQLLHEK